MHKVKCIKDLLQFGKLYPQPEQSKLQVSKFNYMNIKQLKHRRACIVQL